MADTRQRIFKSWAGISEVALIKEVATKGEHIQLCIEYWARKRKLPLAEYKLFFHDVVQTYVHRLLSERLVFKAENVLSNVQRDVRCVYYQFACECPDDELRELLFDYLQKKDPVGYAQSALELQFHWEMLQQLQQSPELLAKCKAELRRVNLETLLHSDAAFLRRLQVELYFANRNASLLERLDKFAIWDYLVEIEDMAQLARWCCLIDAPEIQCKDELEVKFCQWSIEPEMYESAIKDLKAPNDIVRNCFASAGYFFSDERDKAAVVVRRICTTESLQRNQQLLEKLSMGHFLLQQGLHFLMLRSFVNLRELEEMVDEYADEAELLKLIVALKEHDLHKRHGFEQVFFAAKMYLERNNVNFESEQTLVSFYAFLCNEPSVAALNCFFLSSTLQCVPYLRSLANRLENSGNNSSTGGPGFPTPYDFLLKFQRIDFRRLCKEIAAGTLASFSNERLCAKYARKCKLNIMHYLKQQRSSYAVYYLLLNSLQEYGQITKNQLFSACEAVTELALTFVSNEDLIVHCVAFVEMLGYDSQHLRNFLKLYRLLDGGAQEAAYVDTPTTYSQLLQRVEAILLHRIENHLETDAFPLMDYQALMRVAVGSQRQEWPELIMRHYARGNDWWRLLVLFQYFDVPLAHLQSLIGVFETRTVGEHLLRAILHDPTTQSKRHASCSNRQQKNRKMESNAMTSSIETITSSISSACNDGNNALFPTAPNQMQLQFLPDGCGQLDLFAIILLSTSSLPEELIPSASRFLEMMQDQHNYATSSNLLKNCIKYQLPVLAILAAVVNPTNVDWHWLVWLAVGTDQKLEVLATLEPRDMTWHLIENAVEQGETCKLKRSLYIFFEDNALTQLCSFLQSTQHRRKFDDEDVNALRLYLLAWSNNEISLPFCNHMRRDDWMLRSIKLLLRHLQCNFDSIVEQQKFVGCICRSGMSDISAMLDFCQLHAVFIILQNQSDCGQNIAINFEELLQHGNKEYIRLMNALRDAGEYNLAVQVATLLQLPISDIIYAKWIAHLDASTTNGELGIYDGSTLERYEAEIKQHTLPPELLVNFLLHAAERLVKPCTPKFELLKRALNVIKEHHLLPNESFDRDQIEYEMVVCYLQLDDAVETLAVYHSQYYEQVMLKERRVLYKSFLELKELAGIEDLNVSMKQPLTAQMQRRLGALLNQLLEEGDIVEALRLQELFEFRPMDLRFVVFCMALAEGVTTIVSMSSEERQLLRDAEKSSFAKFNKRTLDSELRTSGSHHGQSSPSKTSYDLSDSCSTLEFEEIPSKEKRETLDTIQGIASKLKYGVDIGRRILMVYRAAMYLDREYLDVLRTKDITVLLQNVTEESCLHRLLVVNDILTSTHMTPDEIADLLAHEITTAIVRPRFYILNTEQSTKNTFKNADIWGYNIDRDFHLFLELAPNTTKLGNRLLEYCDALKAYRKYQDNKPYVHDDVFERFAEIIRRYGLPPSNNAPPIDDSPSATTESAPPLQVLSHKKQNLICVELLIKAHQCYVHECSMEGMADVLNRTKALNSVLTKAKSWSLIVRMLSGIGRYREMFYCFDALIKNEQFESLLRQFDEDKTIGLRQAIITYLREYCPENAKEYLKLAALHFLMYQELAGMWEHDSQEVLEKLLTATQVESAQLPKQLSMANLVADSPTKTFIPKLRSSPELLTTLQQVMENYVHATENYLLANKLLMAQRTAHMAEMVAMQIDLATKALERNTTSPPLCVCVIHVQTREEFLELINGEMSVPQALILSRAYGFEINWSEVLLAQYVILKRANYLQEYLMHLSLNDNIIDNIVKGFQIYAQRHRTQPQMEEHLAHLVTLVKGVTLRYQLASLLSIKPLVMSLINEQTSYYLRDTNYGRSGN